MYINEVIEIIDGNIVPVEERDDIIVDYAFASDLMSDVLTLEGVKVLLITGLTNLQTIRTAEMADIECVVFARNKKVSYDMIKLANDSNIVLIECRYSVFKTCGLLYSAGLKPVF